jgi:hypothetical protein
LGEGEESRGLGIVSPELPCVPGTAVSPELPGILFQHSALSLRFR